MHVHTTSSSHPLCDPLPAANNPVDWTAGLWHIDWLTEIRPTICTGSYNLYVALANADLLVKDINMHSHIEEACALYAEAFPEIGEFWRWFEAYALPQATQAAWYKTA